jgi:hypothetical protein
VYRLFIDEVGHDNLNTANDSSERYLCLLGLIVELESANKHLIGTMEALKVAIFKTPKVVLHRREIIDKKPPPFDLLEDSNTRDAFDQGLLNLIATCEYRVVAVLIDKKEHIERYAVWRSHPYHYCLRAMLERYVMHLNDLGATGDVMAEWRGVKPNRKLEAAYKHIYTQGTENMSRTQFQARLSSGQLKIQKKGANIAGLQLADLLASPVNRSLLCKKNKVEMTAPFGKRVVEILLESKYRRSHKGKIEGYGLKLLP